MEGEKGEELSIDWDCLEPAVTQSATLKAQASFRECISHSWVRALDDSPWANYFPSPI